MTPPVPPLARGACHLYGAVYARLVTRATTFGPPSRRIIEVAGSIVMAQLFRVVLFKERHCVRFPTFGLSTMHVNNILSPCGFPEIGYKPMYPGVACAGICVSIHGKKCEGYSDDQPSTD